MNNINALIHVDFVVKDENGENLHDYSSRDGNLYLLTMSNYYDDFKYEHQMQNMFDIVNEYLCTNFKCTYANDDISVDTLMKGIEIYTNGKVSKITTGQFSQKNLNINGYYEVYVSVNEKEILNAKEEDTIGL